VASTLVRKLNNAEIATKNSTPTSNIKSTNYQLDADIRFKSTESDAWWSLKSCNITY